VPFVHPQTLSILSPVISYNNNKEDSTKNENDHFYSSVKRFGTKSRFDINLEIIEQELNLNYLSLLPEPLEESLPFLLSYQVRRLKIFIDIMTEENKANANDNSGKNLEGTTRNIPFSSYF